MIKDVLPEQTTTKALIEYEVKLNDPLVNDITLRDNGKKNIIVFYKY